MKAGKRLLALLICGALVGGNVLPVYAEKGKENESIINEVDSTEEIEQSEVEVLGEQPIINSEPTEEEKSEAKEDVTSEDEQETEQFEQDNTRVTGESWLWPVKDCMTISSGYGYRTHPTSGQWKLHAGIDIPAQTGTPIRATQSGYLVVKGYNQYRGNWSVIDHQNGTYSDYQHMSSYAISSNQWVNQGDIIGYVGSSGDVTGAHLHFEIRTGAVNQAGNYDSLTPVNTNKDSINYVYDIVQLPDITDQTPIATVDSAGMMSTRFNAVNNVHHYDIVLFGTNNVEIAYINIGTNTGGMMQLPRKGLYYVRIYAYSSSGDRTISKSAEVVWSGENINIGKEIVTGIKSKNGNYLFTESSDGFLKKGTFNGNTKDLNKYLFKIVRLNDNNEYAIYNKLNNKALTVGSGGLQNSTGLLFKTYTGDCLQKFVFKDMGDKTGYIISPVGSNYILDAGAVETNNMYIYIYTSYENNNQYFLLEQLIATPSPVANLKAVSAGKNKVKLTWDLSIGAEGYLIYAQKNGKYAYCGMVTKGIMYTDIKALDSDYNFYWVFPYVQDSTGKMHPGRCTKYVFAKGVTAAVTNLKVASQTDGIKLTWTASVGAEGYLVYGKTSVGKYGYIGMTTKGTSYVDKKASKKEYNFYWVYPYHKDKSGKMIVGGTPKYVYGKVR